ncbi:hypothetical protein B0H13DRAFT_1907483 [Mycena leptocephala]|nr:hypothetical protein B0H13DRAFT_1907483 [Mycena leptocephala]
MATGTRIHVSVNWGGGGQRVGYALILIIVEGIGLRDMKMSKVKWEGKKRCTGLMGTIARTRRWVKLQRRGRPNESEAGNLEADVVMGNMMRRQVVSVVESSQRIDDVREERGACIYLLVIIQYYLGIKPLGIYMIKF